MLRNVSSHPHKAVILTVNLCTDPSESELLQETYLYYENKDLSVDC